MSTRGRVILAIIVAIVAIDLALVGVDRLAGGPRAGPVASSFNASPQGLAGYADLLRRVGHPVTQLRASLTTQQLDPRSTIVVLDSQISADEAHDLARFVDGGGRLICGGIVSTWLSSLVPDPPSLAPITIDDSVPLAPVPEITDISHVRSVDTAAWTRTHSALPALGKGELSLLAVEDVGAGRIEFLASSSPLQNQLLGDDNDAALGLALAGEASRPVVFAENGHGYGNTGLRAIPAGARWMIVILALAGLLWVGSRVRRLGPPTPSERPLAPPRRLFVESLAQTLTRTRGNRAAVGPLRSAARDRLLRIASLPSDADDAALRDAAIRFGLSEAEAAALTRHATSDGEVVTLGRAYAKLSD